MADVDGREGCLRSRLHLGVLAQSFACSCALSLLVLVSTRVASRKALLPFGILRQPPGDPGLDPLLQEELARLDKQLHITQAPTPSPVAVNSRAEDTTALDWAAKARAEKDALAKLEKKLEVVAKPVTTTTTVHPSGPSWRPGQRFPEPVWLRTPSEPHKVAEVNRSGNDCPSKVTISEWNGRIGNHIHQIAQAVVFAKLCNADTLTLPPKVVGHYQNQAGVIDPPAKMSLPFGVPVPPKVPLGCPNHGSNPFYHSHCHGVNALDYRAVVDEYVRPMLSPNISKCLAAPDRPEEATMLTIHMRGDDVHQYPPYLWGQPPCSMHRKVILDGKYKFVTVVAVGGNSCLTSLLEWGKNNNVQVVHHLDGKGKIHDDLCAIARARYLLVSFSTFSLSATFLNQRLKVLYRRRNTGWSTFLHAMLPFGQCGLWPGVELVEYDACYQGDCQYCRQPHNGVVSWSNVPCGSDNDGVSFLRDFPMDQVVGPLHTCT